MNLDNLANLDFRTGVQTAFFICLLLFIVSLVAGIRTVLKSRGLKFFRMRHERQVAGWRLILTSVLFALIAVFLNTLAEPIIYHFIPPTATLTSTPTITLTPTISLTPTITLSPTITPTPSVSDTPTITPTPRIPLAIEAQFQSSTTPSPASVFSPLVFTLELDQNFLPVDPAEVFQNPVGHLYAWFTYDQMTVGAQWTAIWYRGGEVVHYETLPWNGGTGGIGYTDWEPPAYEWLPGEYEVQIFVGYEWKVASTFTVEGEAPPPPPTATPTNTATITPSPTDTATVTPTPTNTLTRTPTNTPRPTNTRWPTATEIPTQTLRP